MCIQGHVPQLGLLKGSSQPASTCGPVVLLSRGSGRGSPSRLARVGRAQLLVVRGWSPRSLAGCQRRAALSLSLPASHSLKAKPVVERGQSSALVSDLSLLPCVSSSPSPGSWRRFSAARAAGLGEAHPENPGSFATFKVRNLHYICKAVCLYAVRLQVWGIGAWVSMGEPCSVWVGRGG